MALLIFSPVTAAEENVDQQVIARIKMEGFQSSKVMETLFYLTDVHGPRLHGSPGFQAAAEWSRDRLAAWGLENAHLESWKSPVPGWSMESFSIEMTEPRYRRLVAYPMAWTPSTDGRVVGTPVLVDVKSEQDFDRYRGKLKGAIVMNGRPEPPTAPEEIKPRRMDQRELQEHLEAIDPGKPKDYWEAKEEEDKESAEEIKIPRFFKQEEVAALLQPSSRERGVVRVSYTGAFQPQDNPPTLVVAREQYNRIARLVEKDVKPKLAVAIQTRYLDDALGYNVIAEIPGSDPRLKDELVMLGGHLDSWHAGTGATDNGAGCAVVMEVARILKAIDARPRRTVRVALWGGEELDYWGSRHHVERHFANLETMELQPAHEKLSAYFNLDSGTGKIRGVYLQGNEAVRPIFEAYLKPFHYLGATTLTTMNTSGTDHLLFDAVGLPGFTFVQDPMDYDAFTHHTNMDVLDYVSEDDLKQAAVIMASFVYHAAMREERLPRKPLPPPRPRETKEK
jgi:hypothetical protein